MAKSKTKREVKQKKVMPLKRTYRVTFREANEPPVLVECHELWTAESAAEFLRRSMMSDEHSFTTMAIPLDLIKNIELVENVEEPPAAAVATPT